MKGEDQRNHDRFLSHLDDSEVAVRRVAELWLQAGVGVRLAPARKAATRSDWESAIDAGDLFVEHRIEVKRLSVHFTSLQDWPFGRHFIVCSKNSFDRAFPKPWAYLTFNETMTHYAITKTTSQRHWYVEVREDSRYENVEQECYFCPLEYVRFKEIGREPPG